MEERIVDLLRLCLQAKDCGIDAYFGYRAHINYLSVEVYKNGWKKYIEPEKDLLINLSSDDVETQINEIYGYISDLIVEKSSQELAFQESQE